MIGKRREAGMHLAQRAPVAQRVVLPTQHARDVVVFIDTVEATLDDLPYRTGLQHLPDLERRYVGFDVVHAAAHIGIDGHEDVTDQYLAVRGLRHGFFREFEILLRHPARRPAREADLLVGHRQLPQLREQSLG